MTNEIAIRVERDPGEGTLEPIGASLRAYNESKVGKYSAERYAVVAERSSREFMGGLYGWVQWGWLCIDWAFVRPDLRRTGLGGRLLRRFEDIARGHGITRSRLNTGSFQGALPFYQRYGYEIFAQLEIVAPDGSEQIDYFLRKTL